MPKRKRRKKSENRRLVDRCDTWFSLWIRRRDRYTCYTCGKTGEEAVIECGHLISRGKLATRWDPMNANAQCRSCNLKHEHYPEIYTRKWISEHGQEAYDKLVRKAWGIKKYTTSELKILAESLEELALESG